MLEPDQKVVERDNAIDDADAPEWPPAPAIMPPTPPPRRVLPKLTTSPRADMVVGAVTIVAFAGAFGFGAALLSPFIAIATCFYYPYVGRGMLLGILIPIAAFVLHAWPD